MSTGDEADGVHATSNSLSEQAENDKKRKRAAKWSQEESIALLKSLRDLVQESEGGKQCVKGPAKWERISEELVGHGYQKREATSVGERWDKICQGYLKVEKHLRASDNFAQALRETRKEFKFLPAEYTQEWHALAATCDPRQKKKQRNGGAELAMVENTDALPCDVSPASVSFETIPQAFRKFIRSVESLLSCSRDAASPSQRCDETDELGDIVRSLLSIVEAVKTNAKFEKSEPYYSLEIDKREWKLVHGLAHSLSEDHGRRSRPTPRDANSSLPEQAEQYRLIEDPTKCQITTIIVPTLGMMREVPPLGMMREEQTLYYVDQGNPLLLWRDKSTFMLKDWKHGLDKFIHESSWQLLCHGDNMPIGDCHRDCKDGQNGTRVVEATSTSIDIYDVFHRKENPPHFKDWSPLWNIKPNNGKVVEDKITKVLLHPHENIVFWGTEHGVVGSYDFENENLTRRVHLPQLGKNSRGYDICNLIFSIVLNVLVFRCRGQGQMQLFTWTLNDEHVERINGLDDHNTCDLHNDQVQLLVTAKCSLAIWDLRQRKELHRWDPEDTTYAKGWIRDAKYSCDGELVYAVFAADDKLRIWIGVFDACLQLRCRITPSAYNYLDNLGPMYFGQIVAHPQKRNQFAINSCYHNGVYVIEPSHKLGGEWVCKANEGVGRQIWTN